MDSVFRKRIKRRLYYGDVADLDTPSLPLTELTVEYFKDSVSQELGHIDLDVASDLVRKNNVSPSSVVMSVLYAKRLRQKNKPYLESISSSDVFFISMMMASKYMYDEGVEEEVFNDEWADSFEQEVDDVNQMETDFLQAMDWRLFVRPEEFETVLADIERRLALREGIRRGWYTYSEMSVLANWSLFTQLWNNVGLECTKLGVIMSATYVTSLLSLLGTTAIAVQLSGPLSSAVVSGVSDHLVPAVMSGWQALPHCLPPDMNYDSALRHEAIENLYPDYPFQENQSATNHIGDTGNSKLDPIKLSSLLDDGNVTIATADSTGEDIQTTARSPSLLSILFLDSLLSQIWSVQSGNISKQKAHEKNQNLSFEKEEHTFCHRRTGMRHQRRNCRQNETSGSDLPPSSSPTNSFSNHISRPSDIKTEDEFVYRSVDWPYLNVEQLPHELTCTCNVPRLALETGGIRRRKECCFWTQKSEETQDDYSLRRKMNVDIPLTLLTGSQFLQIPHDFHAGFRTDAKIT